MKMLKILLCGLLLALPVFAEESEDRQTATSLHYVAHELDTRQDKLTTGTNAALTYTNSAGNVLQRDVKANLNGGTTDTSLPQVNAVNAGLDTKQNDIATIDDHTAVTYTGQTGTIGQKGIYQDTGTYAEQMDNLIDAKTFNAALKTGLDNEFVCGGTKPGTDTCWLWQIHTNTVPAGYTALDFLGNTGTQYIDTGLLPSATPKFIIEWSPTAYGSNYLTGARVSDGNLWCGVMGTLNGQTINSVLTRTNRDIGVNFNTTRTLGNWYRNESTLEYDATNGYRGKFILDDLTNGTQEIKYSDYTTDTIITETTNNILVFAVRSNNIHPGVKIRRYQYFENYTDTAPAMDLVPCRRNSDDTLGMCDMVSGTFKTNVGNGTFTAGLDIGSVNIYIPQNQQ